MELFLLLLLLLLLKFYGIANIWLVYVGVCHISFCNFYLFLPAYSFVCIIFLFILFWLFFLLCAHFFDTIILNSVSIIIIIYTGCSGRVNILISLQVCQLLLNQR